MKLMGNVNRKTSATSLYILFKHNIIPLYIGVSSITMSI